MIGSSIAANNRRCDGAVSRAIAVGPADAWLGTLARRGRLDSTAAMTPNRTASVTARPSVPVPAILVSWMAIFRPCFTAPVWNHILVLVAGTVLAPGKRTVTQALRVMGLAEQPGFGRYHEALNRARWNARDVARRLLLHLLAVLSPSARTQVHFGSGIPSPWPGG